MGGSRGREGTGGPEKSQKYRVSINTGQDPLKNHKATKLDWQQSTKYI